MKNLCRRNTFDYRRHLEMQVSDCVKKCIFPSTSTLLNPMRPSSQSFIRKIWLGDKPIFPSYSSLFCPEFDHMPNFFRTFCFHLGIVCFCNPMTCSAFHGRWPNLLSTLFLTRSAKRLNIGDIQASKQTNCSL